MNREQQLRDFCLQFSTGSMTIETFTQKYDELYHSNDEKHTKLASEEINNLTIPPLIYKINNDESYKIQFPIEMRNKHYIMDLLDILTESLFPFVDLLRKNYYIEEIKGNDIYYILKFLKQNFNIWTTLLSIFIDKEKINICIDNLLNLRNSINHQNPDVMHNINGFMKTISTKNIEQSFQDSIYLLQSIKNNCNIDFAIYNLEQLVNLFNVHYTLKKKRKFIF